MLNPAPQTTSQRPGTESLESWLARHPLLAPLHGMHTRQKEQVQLPDEAVTQLIGAADHPNPKVRIVFVRITGARSIENTHLHHS